MSGAACQSTFRRACAWRSGRQGGRAAGSAKRCAGPEAALQRATLRRNAPVNARTGRDEPDRFCLCADSFNPRSQSPRGLAAAPLRRCPSWGPRFSTRPPEHPGVDHSAPGRQRGFRLRDCRVLRVVSGLRLRAREPPARDDLSHVDACAPSTCPNLACLVGSAHSLNQ